MSRHEAARVKLKPRHSLYGALSALGIMGTWAALLATTLTLDWHGWRWAWAPVAIALQTFLYTGLFITAHDAMHGTACWTHRRLNRWLGRMALALYALFSLDRLIAKHREHHASPASEHDPDFHNGTHRGFWRWYGTFLWRYVSVWQILGMAIVFNIGAHLLHIPEHILLLFWVLPSVCSTLQLFYFGTYLPHKEPSSGEYTDAHRARSNAFPDWLSFLTCYHFGYHWEHHESPAAPWWMLPSVRRRVQTGHDSSEEPAV